MGGCATATRLDAMTRYAAVAAPALMLIYGHFRWADGLDGDRGNGWAWDVGHVAFLLAMLHFGVLVAGLARWAPTPRPLMRAAVAVALVGIACFVWVIVDDLIDALPTPSAILIGGPALFQLGALTVLIRLVVARLLPWWSPALVLAGFAAIGIALDLLPIGAVVIGAGLYPVLLSRPKVLT
jgi:hypothetical protein